MKLTIPMRLSYPISAFLGILLTLSFAPFSLSPLAILSPLFLCALIRHQSRSTSFRLGYSYGLGFFGSSIYWVYISVYQFANAPLIIAILLTVSLVCFLALFPALAVYLTQRYFVLDTKEKWIFAFPAIWVSIEWLRSILFTGFPWVLIGYSQNHTFLKGYAPIFSVYGVTLAVLMSSGLLLTCYDFYQALNKKAAATYLLWFLVIWGIGGTLSLIPWTITSNTPVNVSLIQGNIPQTLKWNSEYMQLSLDRYRELTLPLLKKDNVIIWPEAAIPLSLQAAEDYINELQQSAEKNNANIILGIPIQANDQQNYFNAIITLGDSKQVYLKRRLVPFGEYTPFSKLTSFIMNWLDIPMSTMIPGNDWQAPLKAGPLLLQSSLCYEIAFPELMRFIDPEINSILTLTNDAWFGDSSAKAQHLQMASMRAIELARPVFFVSNDGITAILNSDGSVNAEALPNKTTVLSATVFLKTGVTPWMTNGIDPILFIIIVFLYHTYQRSKKTLTLTKSTGELNARTIFTTAD